MIERMSNFLISASDCLFLALPPAAKHRYPIQTDFNVGWGAGEVLPYTLLIRPDCQGGGL